MAQVTRARSRRATSPTWSRTRSSTRWSTAVRAAYPALSHRYYALKAAGSAATSSTTGTATRRCPSDDDRTHRLARGARDRARRPMRASRRSWPTIGRRFFDERWIDAPVRPGKAPGAFAHPTVPSRAPLPAAELPGQDARRDDAGARARPRRAPGAGGGAGPPDGRHAADPGRDRLGVRRDADLPRDARRRDRPEAPARSCSPARSRTC